jgi:hypothetical protein
VELAFTVLFTLPMLALASPGAAVEESLCRPLPGAELLWSRASLRFVNVGEAHGSNEVPEIFGDLVCSARASGRPIVVGLEMGSQTELDAFFAEPNRAAAEKRILGSDEWRAGGDGRTSKAMLALLTKLAALQRQGVVKKVVAISVSRMEGAFTDQESFLKVVASGEKRMAEVLIRAAGESPDALVITLAGSLHASKRKGSPGFIPYDSMGAYLPPEETVALVVDHLGGTTWGCDQKGCGPQPWKSTLSRPRGVFLDRKSSESPDFDGTLAIGTRVTASPPANGGKPFRHSKDALIQKPAGQ